MSFTFIWQKCDIWPPYLWKWILLIPWKINNLIWSIISGFFTEIGWHINKPRSEDVLPVVYYLPPNFLGFPKESPTVATHQIQTLFKICYLNASWKYILTFDFLMKSFNIYKITGSIFNYEAQIVLQHRNPWILLVVLL